MNPPGLQMEGEGMSASEPLTAMLAAGADVLKPLAEELRSRGWRAEVVAELKDSGPTLSLVLDLFNPQIPKPEPVAPRSDQEGDRDE